MGRLLTQAQAECLVGDVFVSAACIAYFGAFTGPYRADLCASWVSKCRELGLPLSKDVTLRDTLASPIEVRTPSHGIQVLNQPLCPLRQHLIAGERHHVVHIPGPVKKEIIP